MADAGPEERWRPLEGRTVVLGVSGGIAAYKAVEVCRRLSDAGARVLPVLTRRATQFVGPLTFSALAAEPARVSLFSAGSSSRGRGGAVAGERSEAVPHIALARRADLVVVAPATARLLGSYAGGISSDLLSATLLATKAPVLLCPSMHSEMWEHPAVQDNVALLRRRGVEVLEPGEGRLAGGDVGKGRLPAPETIVAAAEAVLLRSNPAPGSAAPGSPGPLAGARVVVSAGGTREPIDPVRYVGNRSSGKQGYAVAAELVARGAEVTLVSTASLAAPPGVHVVEVETAGEMADAVLSAAGRAEVVVMAAAVADYRPANVAERKWEKSTSPVSVELVPTLDILAELGRRRRPGQVLVGFAAETAGEPAGALVDEVPGETRGETAGRTGGEPDGERAGKGPLAELAQRGRAKLVAKGADLVVANLVGGRGVGFGSDCQSAVIVSRERSVELGLVDKRALAKRLADEIEEALTAAAATTSAARAE